MIPHLTSLYYPTSNILQDEKKKSSPSLMTDIDSLVLD